MTGAAVLRSGVLAGRVVAVTAPGGPFAVRAAELGARVVPLGPDLGDEDALAAAVAQAGELHALVADAGRLFRDAGGGIAALRLAVDGAFAATRAVARGAMIPASPDAPVPASPDAPVPAPTDARVPASPDAPAPVASGDGFAPAAPAAGGAVVLLAPRPGDGEHAGPTRAALENTACTLSTEWARFAITPTAVLPGDATTDGELAELAAFLVSGAGAYCSGCAFTLGQVSSP